MRTEYLLLLLLSLPARAVSASAQIGTPLTSNAPWNGVLPALLLSLAVLSLVILLLADRRRAKGREAQMMESLRQEKLANTRLRQTDTPRGQFRAYASHALRTPLADVSDPSGAPRDRGARTQPPTPRAIGARILIVDDEPVNRQVIHSYLAPAGYTVEQVDSGPDALRVLGEQPRFDLILLDIMMPHMSGYEVCQEIRRHSPRETLPVIFLTARSQVSDLTTGFAVGGNDYLIKPVTKEELLVRIQTHLELMTAHRSLEVLVAERTAQVEALTQKKEELLAIAAHDLRTPVVNLKGFAAELRADLESLKTAQTQGPQNLDRSQAMGRLWGDIEESLGFIDAASNRMETLVNGVVELHRLTRIDLEFERIDLQALAKAILENLEYQVGRIEAVVIVQPLPSVTADRHALEIILQNLLSNAVKYLDPQRPGKIDIQAQVGPMETVIQVRDNGRGIAHHEMPKVFKLFGRAGSQDAPGEGMGLAYVQALVEHHGGRIGCRSTVDSGSIFHFTLPHREPGRKARTRPENTDGSTATGSQVKAVG